MYNVLDKQLPFKVIGATAGTGEAFGEATATLADPTDPTGRHTGHEGIVGHIAGDHGAGGNEGTATHRMPADHRAVGAKGSTFFY